MCIAFQKKPQNVGVNEGGWWWIDNWFDLINSMMTKQQLVVEIAHKSVFIKESNWIQIL